MVGCKKKRISEAELLILKEMVDNNLNLYLDKLTLQFGVKTGI